MSNERTQSQEAANSNFIPNYVNFNYGKDYVNIRNRFQKGYTSIAGEPGYFYFRVFFDFSSSPLLRWSEGKGNIMRNITAQQFLYNNWERCHCEQRYYALHKFRKLLYFIVKDTPWAISKVSGTGDSAFVDPAAPGKGTKTIKLDFSPEFTDFRTTLLLDLYRYIYFDSNSQRIILPENLRKFNMSVLYFSVPLKWFHTPIKSQTHWKSGLQSAASTISAAYHSDVNAGKEDFNYPKYGELLRGNIEDFYTREYYQNTISVHLMNFLDCEILPKSTYSTFTGGSSDRPSTPVGSMEISYLRAYTQDISEWFELQLSELEDVYYDSDKEEHMPDAAPTEIRTDINRPSDLLDNRIEKFRKRMKKFGVRTLDLLQTSLMGANSLSSYTGSAADLTKRRRYIKGSSDISSDTAVVKGVQA